MKRIKSLQEITLLIDKAIKGELSREEFYGSWRDEWDNDEYLKMVYANLEDAVEHLPAELFSGRIDLAKWQSSKCYEILQADKVLLDQYHNLSTLQLLGRRRKIK